MSALYTLPTPSYTLTPPAHTPSTPPNPPQPPAATPPPSIPPLLYRVHRPSSQTRYAFSTGFSAKNHTTIVNYRSALSRFGLAHLTRQTNISSPFISVYDDKGHAERVARYFWERGAREEEVCVVTVDTRYFARGPVFRAADILEEGGGGEEGGDGGTTTTTTTAVRESKTAAVSREEDWLHWGEYLVMYRIPPQAIRDETVVGRGAAQKWNGSVGVIGSGLAT